MELRSHVAALLASVLGAPPYESNLRNDEIARMLEVPREANRGDLAFPCFTLAKALRQAPPKIAQELATSLATALKSASSSLVERVEAAGPFLNFFASPGGLARAVLPAILDGSTLERRPALGVRMMIEYSQPNTHKAFHVGHTRCASLGDSLIRIAEWCGYDVVASNYIGDEGTHVARCLWYLLNRFDGEIPETNRGEFLGVLYTQATRLLELESLTAVPLPGVSIARVLDSSTHPSEKEWSVVTLDDGSARRTVVSAVRSVPSGANVLYLAPGTRLGNRQIGAVDKKGVMSEGMVLSEAEAGLSDDKTALAIAPESLRPGELAIEAYRFQELDFEKETVLATLAAREAEVSDVLRRIETGDSRLKEVWDRTKKWSLDEFHQVYDWLNCRFDHYFYESECGDESKAIAKRYLEKGVFVMSDGALGADLKPFNLGFCILIKSDGTSTYAARDLVLAERKFREFGVQRSEYVVDSAQNLHFQQVFKCLELMGYPQAKDCYHLGYAQVVLPDGKMSSRKGNVILFSALKDRLRERILAEFLEKYRGEWPDEEIDAASHALALATIRYGMLSQDNNSLIVFNLEEWTSRSGNTGPYMMYAYARMRSMLAEVRERHPDVVKREPSYELLTHESEKDLLVYLDSYEEFVQRAFGEHAPNTVCAYVYELARRFNRWYANCSVLHADSDAVMRARYGLAEATGGVLKHGLSLLGIRTIERM